MYCAVCLMKVVQEILECKKILQHFMDQPFLSHMEII